MKQIKNVALVILGAAVIGLSVLSYNQNKKCSDLSLRLHNSELNVATEKHYAAEYERKYEQYKNLYDQCVNM